MTDNRIFKIKNFQPVGIKVRNFEIDICVICRGKLINVCNSCLEKEQQKCPIVNHDGVDYHHHCYNFMKKSNEPEPPKKSKHNYSDSESD
jgi:hypothetical protein